MSQTAEPAKTRLRVLNNPTAMARLLMSVGTRTRDRPLTPYDAAIAIKDLVEDIKSISMTEDNETPMSESRALQDAARRLGVTASTCQEFLQVLKMPETWKGILVFHGNRKDGRLPFTIARKLGPRYVGKKLSEDELDMLKSVAFNQAATRDDIEDIVVYKEKNKSLSLEECIKHIMNLTPVITKGFVTITDTNPILIERAKSAFAATTKEEALQKLLLKYLGKSSIKESRIKHEVYAQIVFQGKKDSERFYELAEKYDVPPNDLINHLLMLEIGEKI